MSSLAKEYIIVNNADEYIHGDVEVIEQSDGQDVIYEEAQIVEEHDEPSAPVSNEHTQSASYRIWTTPAVKLMLCLVEDLLPDVGTTSKLPTKAEMYKYVAQEMAKEGYSFTGSQVDNKFRSIEKAYKRKQLLDKANESMERRRREAESLLDNDESKSDTEVVWMEDHTESHGLERTTEDDFPSTVKKHSNSPRLKIFAKMASERKRYHENLRTLFKAKEQRTRRREERDRQILQLLEVALGQKT